MRSLSRLLMLTLPLATVACSDRLLTDADSGTGGPLQNEVANVEGFAWLPPTVKQPGALTGTFDGSRTPTVRVVCTGVGAGCPTIDEFTMGGSGPAAIKVDQAGENYHLLWHAPSTLALGSGHYRVEVLDGATVVGTGQLWVTARQSEANLVPGTHIGLVRGQPFMIKFRLAGADLPLPVSAVISAEGGNLSGALPGGARVELEIPAGALTKPTLIRLTPRVPAEGEVIAFAIAPSSIAFQRPATITITLPALPPDAEASVLALASRLGGGPAFYFSTVASTGPTTAFVIQVPALGSPGPWLDHSPVGAAFRLAGQMALNGVDPQDLELALVEARARERIEALKRSVEELEETGQFMEAIRVRSSAQAMFQLYLPGDPEEDRLVREIQVRTCEGVRRVYDLAPTRLGADFANLWTALEPVYAWSAAADQTGLDEEECPPRAALNTVVADLVNQFTELYTAAMERANFVQHADGLELELYRALRVRGMGEQLAMATEFQSLKTLIQRPLAARFRSAAYAWCRTDHEQTYLGRLFRAARNEVMLPPIGSGPSEALNAAEDFGFSANDLQSDIQYCGTEVEATSRQPEGFGSTSGPFGGGAVPGAVTLPSEPIRVYAGGTLLLDGTLLALYCLTENYGNDRIGLDLAGVRVRSLDRVAPTGHFIRSGPIELDVDDLAEQAGVDPALGATLPLGIVRTGNGCGGDYHFAGEPGERTLLEVPLRFPRVTLTVSPATATLQPGEKLSIRAIQRIDDEPSDAVSWSVTGGSFTVPDPSEPDVIEFTAGETDGSFQVVVQSGLYPSLRATVQVAIKDETCPSPDAAPAGMVLSTAGCPEPLQIVKQILPRGRIYLPYVGVTLQTFNAKGPVTWSIVSGALPPGLGLDASTGEIGGTPGEVGGYKFRVRATAAGEIAEEDFEDFEVQGLGSGPVGFQVVVFGHFSLETREFRLTVLRDPFPLRIEWTVSATRRPVGSAFGAVDVTDQLQLGRQTAMLLNADGDVRWTLPITRPANWFVTPQSARQFDYFIIVRGCAFHALSGTPFLGSTDELGFPIQTCGTLRWTIAGSASQ